METALDDQNFRDRFLTCHSCKCEFNDRDHHPHLLPCLHSFCYECLQRLYTEQCIKCPDCRVCHQSSTLDNFKKDNTRRDLLDYVNAYSKEKTIKCESCYKEEIATHRCKECEHFLCDNCVQTHKNLKKLSEHEIFLLNEQANQLENFRHRSYCTEKGHENDLLRMYCSTCTKPVCTVCACTTHDRHKKVDIEEIFAQEKEQISKVSQSVKQKIPSMENVISKVKEELDSVRSTAKEEKTKIEAALANAKAILDRRGEELFKSLNNEEHWRVKVLESQIEMLLTYKESCQRGIEVLERALAHDNKPAFLEISQTIDFRLKELNNASHVSVPHTNASSFRFIRDGLLPSFNEISNWLGSVHSSCAFIPKSTARADSEISIGQKVKFFVSLLTVDDSVIENEIVQIQIETKDEEVPYTCWCALVNDNYVGEWRPKIPGAYTWRVLSNGISLPISTNSVHVKDDISENGLADEENKTALKSISEEGNISGTSVESSLQIEDDNPDEMVVFELGASSLKMIMSSKIYEFDEDTYRFSLFFDSTPTIVFDHHGHVLMGSEAEKQFFEMNNGDDWHCFRNIKESLNGEENSPIDINQDQYGHEFQAHGIFIKLMAECLQIASSFFSKIHKFQTVENEDNEFDIVNEKNEDGDCHSEHNESEKERKKLENENTSDDIIYETYDNTLDIEENSSHSHMQNKDTQCDKEPSGLRTISTQIQTRFSNEKIPSSCNSFSLNCKSEMSHREDINTDESNKTSVYSLKSRSWAENTKFGSERKPIFKFIIAVQSYNHSNEILKNAAEKAGIKPENVCTVNEAIAAAIYAQGPLLSPGSKYIIMSAGDRDVHFTAFQTTEDPRHILPVSPTFNCKCGARSVIQEFLLLFQNLFGEKVWSEFKMHKDYFLNLIPSLQKLKERTMPNCKSQMEIKIPESLFEIHKRSNANEDIYSLSKVSLNEKEINVSWSCGQLLIQSEVIQGFFENSCKNICSRLEHVLKYPNMNDIDTVIMVGGYSKSKMLLHSLESHFHTKKFLVPLHPERAVIEGAALLGRSHILKQKYVKGEMI